MLAPVLASVLVLSGCGSAAKSEEKSEPRVDLPTGQVKVPQGVTLTQAGTVLKFGEPALVAFEPNTERSSVLSLVVEGVKAGKIADFSAYQLKDSTRKSRPYYVQVSVENVGTGDVGGADIPLYAVDERNRLIEFSSFNNTFEKCPSQPLPTAFGADKEVKGCLVYLVPEGGTLTSMSFRPLQTFEPILWEGTIAPADTPKKKDAKKKSKNKKKKANR